MFENLTKQQKRILSIIGIIVVIGIVYFIYQTNEKEEDILPENILVESNLTKEEDGEEEELVIVHITGGVKIPGIVRLKEGSRMEDAIEAAGGLTEDADITCVNLAYVLEDGIKIRIPRLSDEEDSNSIFNEGSGGNIIEENDESTSTNQTSKNININKATESELQTLPGIGASLASRIIDYREQNGKFTTIEEIKNVNGIGESKYDQIKEFICVK